MPFKDTPDGQTHSFNDGCGEPAHNDAELATKSNEIEELETNWKKLVTGSHILDPYSPPQFLYNFLRAIRSQTLQEVCARVEIKLSEINTDGWDDCYSDLLTTLKEDLTAKTKE